MRDRLVGADGPWKTARSLAYAAALARAKRARPGGERRGHDPLGVEPGEQLHQAGVLVADQGVGSQADVVDEDLELLLRADDLHRDLPWPRSPARRSAPRTGRA